MTQTYDANDILMGGGGPTAWKFEEPGTTRTGVVAAPPIARQEREYDKQNPGGGALKFFPSGDPIMGIVVEVNTDERSNPDDDGKRTFYIEGRYIKEAVRNAVRASGAQKLEVGGRLTVKFTHREDPMDKRSRKYWEVTYAPAAQNVLMADDTAQYAQQQPQTQTYAAPATQPQQVAQAPAPAPQPGVVQQPQQVAAAPGVPPQPTPEQLAALRNAGMDPKAVYPHWNGIG